MSVAKSTTYPVTRVPAYYDDFDEKKVTKFNIMTTAYRWDGASYNQHV